MQTLIRRTWRLFRLTVHIGVGLFQTGVLFGFYSPQQKDRAISRWSASLLFILGIRLEANAPPVFSHGALLVANHVSWLDIFVIHATRRVHFVSKHEIRNWPVFGWLAERAGTLFIQRARKSDTMRVNQEMHTLLQDGAWVAVFPEGTSTDGRRLLRFLPSLLQPAVTENLPVVPAAILYQTPDGQFSEAAVYADHVSLGQSLWRISGEQEIVVRLRFASSLYGQDRRQLAERAHKAVAVLLGFEPAISDSGCAGNLPEAPCDPPAAKR